MNYFLKANKNLLIYSLILIIIPFFGINFFISFLGNIILLLFLIPLLLFLLIFIGYKSFNSKTYTCSECGLVSMNFSESCIYCGANLKDISKENQIYKNPSESTIYVKAEEIK